jgi:hypothetical protein
VGDDYKVFVLSPAEIPLNLLGELRYRLLQKPMWGSIRLDIEAALTLAEELVRRSPAAGQGGPERGASIFRSSPRRVMRGLACAYFKSLGSATATMNVSFLGLPGWFPVETHAQVNDWLAILTEHQVRLCGLREDHSDHVSTLLGWRDFLSSGRLEAGLEFFGRYAVLLSQSGEQLVPFTLTNLRRIVVSYEAESPGLTEIITNEGFQNIARAIRACTVNAQWHKRQLDTRRRTDPLRVDIRYGLAQDWRRVVERRDEFVEKLADFVASYNAEAARRMEKGDPNETLISASDLQEVVQLIDTTRKPELVGRLLIAFGYASDWRPRGAAGASPASESPDMALGGAE